jgi:hypothetical protein
MKSGRGVRVCNLWQVLEDLPPTRQSMSLKRRTFRCRSVTTVAFRRVYFTGGDEDSHIRRQALTVAAEALELTRGTQSDHCG